MNKILPNPQLRKKQNTFRVKLLEPINGKNESALKKYAAQLNLIKKLLLKMCLLRVIFGDVKAVLQVKKKGGRMHPRRRAHLGKVVSTAEGAGDRCQG